MTTITPYGFEWGSVSVTREFPLDRLSNHDEPYRVVSVNDLNIYVTPAGRTRVFRGDRELL